MLTIRLRANDNMERSISKLKNLLIREGIFKELKDRRYYAKPSVRKKFKREEAARQRIKDIHKELRSAEREYEEFLT